EGDAAGRRDGGHDEGVGAAEDHQDDEEGHQQDLPPAAFLLGLLAFAGTVAALFALAALSGRGDAAVPGGLAAVTAAGLAAVFGRAVGRFFLRGVRRGAAGREVLLHPNTARNRGLFFRAGRLTGRGALPDRALHLLAGS